MFRCVGIQLMTADEPSEYANAWRKVENQGATNSELHYVPTDSYTSGYDLGVALVMHPTWDTCCLVSIEVCQSFAHNRRFGHGSGYPELATTRITHTEEAEIQIKFSSGQERGLVKGTKPFPIIITKNARQAFMASTARIHRDFSSF